MLPSEYLSNVIWPGDELLFVMVIHTSDATIDPVDTISERFRRHIPSSAVQCTDTYDQQS